MNRGVRTLAVVLVLLALHACSAAKPAPCPESTRFAFQNEMPIDVYVRALEPVILVFPASVRGGFKRKNSALLLERNGYVLTILAQPSLTEEPFRVQLSDSSESTLTFRLADADHPPVKAVIVQKPPVEAGDAGAFPR